MSLSRPVLGRRLRTKTRVLPREQLVVLAEVLTPEECARRKAVYLVTFAHPQQEHSTTGQRLRSPDAYSREDLLRFLQDVFNNPVYVNDGNRAAYEGQRRVRLLKVVIFAEYHKPDAGGVAHRHYHVALKAAESFLFAPFKRA